MSIKINRNISSHKLPYTVVLIDATDAYYYADIMGEWKEIYKINDFGKAKALADALFVEKNYKWKSLEEMNNCDGGFDVRIYDQNHSCVYAAHESFKDHWIGSNILSLHGKDAELAYKAFFSEKGQKSKQTKRPRSKSRITASIVVLLYSFLLFFLLVTVNDHSSNTISGFIVLLLVGNIFIWFLTLGIAKVVKKILKRNIKISYKYPIIGIGILLLIVAFYWYTIRPSTIRSDCATYARSKNTYPARENNYFRMCLVENGMQPESMFVNVGK